MVSPRNYRQLIACLYACFFLVLVAGCGGGGGDAADSSTLQPPLAESFVEIAAVPGPIAAARVGDLVQLNDTESYADSGESLVYNWSFAYRPAGSTAVLQGATTAAPSFTADVAGVYGLELVVSAEGVTSARAITSVIVTLPTEKKPTGPFNHLGLSSNCVNCHDDHNPTLPRKSLVPAKVNGQPDKFVNHIGASNLCQACHSSLGFDVIPAVDHQEVFGNCSQCHDGVTAIGKSPFHVPTEGECNDCHNTTAFLELEPDGSFDHSGISRACSGCHNGTVATGKTPSPVDNPPGTHPDTNTECGYCHTTVTFSEPYPDHTGPDVVGRQCSECHGVSAQGEPFGHPAMVVDCDICHSVVNFSLGIIPDDGINQFDHSKVDPAIQRCDSCHNGNNSIHATGKTPTHPATSEDCGMCHNTETFVGGFDHTSIVGDCSQSGCHTGLPGQAVGKPTDGTHITTSEDCAACHSPGSFTTGFFNHGPGYLNTFACVDCHNNAISIGKLDTHIPTNPPDQDCALCHNTTNFADATFSHTGITGDCASCHDGVISTGKTVNHLPTNQDCSFCHVTTTIGNSTFPFRDTLNFSHTGINSNCESCHNGNPHYVAVGAIGKIGNHIPALNICADCHTDKTTGGFASSATFFSNVHPGIISGCEGCHSSPFLPTASGKLNVVKAASHLPTNQDCDYCHTNSMFKPSIFAHTGITGNCESCHDGSAANFAAGARGKNSAPNHPVTSADCGVCHSVASGDFANAIFDHTGIVNDCARSGCHTGLPGEATGKSQGHVPTSDDCNVCHVSGGSFATAVFNHDVPSVRAARCDSCHDGIHATGTAAKINPPHVEIFGKDCGACHVPAATFAGARYDHSGIVDNCASCHNGTTAPGKTPPPNHVPTSDDCHVCHVTTGFLPATFDHSGIVGNCGSCHNNVFAIGKSVSHVPTNQDCGICHNTRTFTGAVFDHTGIVNNCESCHNGTTAIGKDAKTNPPHMATNLDCHFCHTTATFVGGTWVHGPETAGACNTCHNGTDARGLPASGHFITTAQCDNCHTTTTWAPASTYRHPNNVGYPGTHNSSVTCISCHRSNNEDISGFPHGTYGTTCAACHSRDYDAGEHRGTLFDNRDCGSSGCHRVSARDW